MTAANQRFRGQMLISKERQQYVEIDANKVARGAFYTTGNSWLVKPVHDFILRSFESGLSICLDPFAGGGDLLNVCRDTFNCKIFGFDVDETGMWPVNDSLIKIPYIKEALIVTNPPYLAKYSAARKGVLVESSKYFNSSKWEDLYLLALDRCLEHYKRVVAIVPETFIGSLYPKQHVQSISVLQSNPFQDTHAPVCVVCMDRDLKNGDEYAKVYVDDLYITTIGDITRIKNADAPPIAMRFNEVSGKVALKAVDGGDPDDKIRFLRADEFDYSLDKIKVSSRLMTIIDIPSLNDFVLDSLIAKANLELNRIRNESKDLIFSPFKGNNKAGVRRRRLDYKTARKILARALSTL